MVCEGGIIAVVLNIINVWLYLADLIHEETRLSVYLDSFELHVYNRSETYAHLEELFGLEKKIIPNREEDKDKKKKNTVENKELSVVVIITVALKMGNI